MRAQVLLVPLALAASVARADGPSEPQARCLQELVRSLAPLSRTNALFRGAKIEYSTLGQDAPFVLYRLGTRHREELSARVQWQAGAPSRAWERDDQWNYPIDPDVARREVRTLPDVTGQWMLKHRVVGGVSKKQLAAFGRAARAGIDACLSAVSTWRAPCGTLRWTHVLPDDDQEQIRVEADGTANWRRTSGGGITAEMGIVSADGLDEVMAVLTTNDVCGLGTHVTKKPYATLELDARGVRCEVALDDEAWECSPRTQACKAAIAGIRERMRGQKP